MNKKKVEGKLICFIDKKTGLRLFPIKGVSPCIPDFNKFKVVVEVSK